MTRIDIETFISLLRFELANAREKFPSSECSMTALTEEVGELAKAMLDESQAHIEAEAVQVAVMAARVACEGDSSIENYRCKRFGFDGARKSYFPNEG